MKNNETFVDFLLFQNSLINYKQSFQLTNPRRTLSLILFLLFLLDKCALSALIFFDEFGLDVGTAG